LDACRRKLLQAIIGYQPFRPGPLVTFLVAP
jgi:hypothetical protein